MLPKQQINDTLFLKLFDTDDWTRTTTLCCHGPLFPGCFNGIFFLSKLKTALCSHNLVFKTQKSSSLISYMLISASQRLATLENAPFKFFITL